MTGDVFIGLILVALNLFPLATGLLDRSAGLGFWEGFGDAWAVQLLGIWALGTVGGVGWFIWLAAASLHEWRVW